MTSDDFSTWDRSVLHGFNRLKSLHIDRTCENGLYTGVSDVALILFNENQDGIHLIIRMYSCRAIKVHDVNNTMWVSMCFDDIRSWQHEGVSYKIYDLEEDVFSCSCRKFDVLVEGAGAEMRRAAIE